MEGKLLVDERGHGFNLLYLRLDDRAIDALKRGEPLSIGFFLDKRIDLPEHKRDFLKATIGKNLDLSKCEAQFKDCTLQQGYADKTYLLNDLRAIQRAISEAAGGKPVAEPSLSFIPDEKAPDVPEPKEDINFKDWVTVSKAAQMLGIDKANVYTLVRSGRIESADLGTKHVKKKDVLEYERSRKNSNSRGKVYKVPEGYYSITQAASLLGINSCSVRNNIRKGKLKSQKIGTRHLIEKSYLESFLESKPQWLIDSQKCSQSWHNNQERG